MQSYALGHRAVIFAPQVCSHYHVFQAIWKNPMIQNLNTLQLNTYYFSKYYPTSASQKLLVGRVEFDLNTLLYSSLNTQQAACSIGFLWDLSQ